MATGGSSLLPKRQTAGAKFYLRSFDPKGAKDTPHPAQILTAPLLHTSYLSSGQSGTFSQFLTREALCLACFFQRFAHFIRFDRFKHLLFKLITSGSSDFTIFFIQHFL